MGYTHYFETTTPASDKVWNEFTDTVKKIIKNFAGKIAGGEGTGTPEITNDLVYLNGCESLSEDHETFLIERGKRGYWDFCKTAMKPYDAVVVAILMEGARLEILTWSSDGEDKNGDFDSAKKLLASI